MKANLRVGMFIAIVASLFGGGINYLIEGDAAKALFVTLIGFFIGLFIMIILSIDRKKKN